jgi:hypothetical protein
MITAPNQLKVVCQVYYMLDKILIYTNNEKMLRKNYLVIITYWIYIFEELIKFPQFFAYCFSNFRQFPLAALDFLNMQER